MQLWGSGHWGATEGLWAGEKPENKPLRADGWLKGPLLLSVPTAIQVTNNH